MQKRAFQSKQKQYVTFFEPLPVKADKVLYFDHAPVTLPYAEDFPKTHYHNRYEVGVCESGEGLFLSEQGFYSVSEGDLIFVPPQARHYSRSLHKDALCRCRFVYLQAAAVENILHTVTSDGCEDFLANALRRIPTVIHPTESQRVTALLTELFALCKENAPHSAQSALLRLSTVLLEADRLFPHTKETSTKSDALICKPAAGAEEVAVYLSLHYRESLTAESLAEICHLSESQLRRQFLAAYGMPPIAYRNTLRCKIAAELLGCSNLSISEISDQVGYSTPSDFYRAFRLFKGISPSEYRKQRNAQPR